MNTTADRAGVLFDLDETLIDGTASVRRYAAQFRAEIEPAMDHLRSRLPESGP